MKGSNLFFALWTSIAISIVKRLTVHVTTLQLIFITNLLVLPFMVGLIFLQGGIPKISPPFYPLILSSSLLDTAAAFASFYAIRISSFNPVFTTLIAMFTLGEIIGSIGYDFGNNIAGDIRMEREYKLHFLPLTMISVNISMML